MVLLQLSKTRHLAQQLASQIPGRPLTFNEQVATKGTATVAPTARTITTLCAVGHPETITATFQPNPPPGPATAPTGNVIFTLDLTGNANLISLNAGSATLALGTGAPPALASLGLTV